MAKKNKSGKSLLQPRIMLDADVLSEINEYYSSYLGDTFIGLECFSHPSMERHCCNVLARREGGADCDHCSNIQGRPCPITCDIHWFCLATYAARLGIGVTSRTSGIKSAVNNLDKLTYKELHKLVMERHVRVDDHMEVIPPTSPPKDNAQLELVLGNPKPVTMIARKLSKITHDNEGEDLLTIYAAANLLGWEYARVYSSVNKGEIKGVRHSGAVFVRKSDVFGLVNVKGRSDV